MILIILATITMYYGNSAMKIAKLQDLKTNMLLIQASLKNDLEKYHFETSTMNEENKNSKKSEYLKGKEISSPDCIEIKKVFDDINIKNIINEDYPEIEGAFEYYYLDTNTLKQLGLKDVESSDKNGYYIVAYSMDSTYPNIVEVINTKGYMGNYSLRRIESL